MWSQNYSFFSGLFQSIRECILTKQAMMACSKIACSMVLHSQKRETDGLCNVVEVEVFYVMSLMQELLIYS